MRVIIAGGRDFGDADLLYGKCDRILSGVRDIEIVSGGARGADVLGERYASERGYGLKVFRADWDRHGKSAGYIRNSEMAEYSDGLIAFWDGVSRGTAHMIRTATDMGLKVRVIRY